MPVSAALSEQARAYHKICVLGLGYVGLPTAMMFARADNHTRFEVHGVDISPRILTAIQDDTVGHLYPELAPWWDSVKNQANFAASNQPVESDLFIITVPTPVHPATKRCDLTAVKAATQAILPVLKPGNIVILESTVPPGTTSHVLKPMIEAQGLTVGKDIHLCFSPERVLPGNTTHELIHNHRVLGATEPESAALAKAILSEVIQGEIYLTDDKTAEFCKLAENTYRDVNIALANELSMLADAHGIDMKEARPLINMHPRVNVLTPGIGVGGHCIAVDPWFFVEMDPLITQLIGTSRRVNDMMPGYSANKIAKAVENLEGIDKPRICCVGLTYKPDVADTRESPAQEIVEILKEKGFDVVAYDPLLPEYQNQTLLDAVKDTDYLAVLVNHSAVQAELSINEALIKSRMRTPQIKVF